MNNFAVIGLGRFGQCVVEALNDRRRQVVVIDRSEEKVQRVRDLAAKAIKADAVNAELLNEVIPEGIDCAIVDLGDVIGQSILVTNCLHKMGVKEIVVEAVDDEHAEILRIVGATRVVFPEREAAERLAGMLAGRGVLDFFAVSEGFSMIEIPVPDAWIGRTLVQLRPRQKAEIEIVAFRKPAISSADENWSLINAERPFEAQDIVLVAGASKSVENLMAK
ncbi:MAG: TrkA family potassium uptake protein [Phycisphaerae bacterium]